MSGDRHNESEGVLSPPFDPIDRTFDAQSSTEQIHLITRFQRAVSAQLDNERANWFLWVPVLFAVGSLGYFSLATEPEWAAIAAFVCGGVAISFFLPQGTMASIARGIILSILAGVLAAKARTEIISAPVLPPWSERLTVTGTVESIENRVEGGQRLLVGVQRIEELDHANTPQRLRVYLRHRQDAQLFPGATVSFIAQASAPPGPVSPRGFDFARWAYFQSIGGIGFVSSKIKILSEPPSPPGLYDHVITTLAQLRHEIGLRIKAVLPGQTGAIATALITGARAEISKETNTAFRNSGLYHILSISGLHMAIMGGSIFFAVRYLLALFPTLVLRFSIKKWAAMAALIGATFYLLISGGSVATIRSFIMISVMFAAILLNRPALALRNVAVAGLIILLLYPESVFNPGFQMSFAAVIALIAGYENIATWWRRRNEGAERQHGIVVKVGGFLFGIIVSTLLASAAVAPIVAYHFHSGQQLAVLANLLAVPVTNFVVMPGALLTLLLMPFGAEAAPLSFMGFGVDLMQSVAIWVAGLPGAVVHFPAFSASAFALIIAGGLWLALMSMRWRLLGLLAIAVGALLAPNLTKPDVLIDRQGKTVAIRDTHDKLYALTRARSTYAIESWLTRDGDGRDTARTTFTPASIIEDPTINSHVFRCDWLGCRAKRNGKTIAIAFQISALYEDCQVADVIVFSGIAPKRCHDVLTMRRKTATAADKLLPLMIDARSLRKLGAHAVYMPVDKATYVESSRTVRGQRPWSSRNSKRQAKVKSREE